jgi:hypothetical protein
MFAAICAIKKFTKPAARQNVADAAPYPGYSNLARPQLLSIVLDRKSLAWHY